MNIRDEFKGDDAALRASVKALIEISDDGAMAPHPLGCHSRALLAACYCRIGGMIRLDDPVVTGLVAAATANLQALRETLRIFRQNGFIYPEGRMAVNETKEALSAYEARVKGVSSE
jgi:hypothetical protein